MRQAITLLWMFFFVLITACGGFNATRTTQTGELSAQVTKVAAKLYAHPCGNGDPNVRHCMPSTASIDLKGKVVTCKSLGLKLGDSCPASLEKCETIPARACAEAPTTQISSATYLFCRTTPFDDSTMCPVSSASVKRQIHYITADERKQLSHAILNTKLSKYYYKDGVTHDKSRQLGFIIEDQPGDSLFVSEDKTRVNLYAFTSAAVAAIQQLKEELAQQAATIDQLKQELIRVKEHGK